jgi:murein DD-endopeptidase MepM/ murein hydrolase activator NlpD
MFNPLSPNPGPRLIYSFAKAQIGEDIFVSGDRDGLMEARVFLGEGERQSNCSFLVWDPQSWWAQKYFSASYADGGLVGLGPPPASGTNTTSAAGLGDDVAIGFSAADREKHELNIVGECLRQGVKDKGQIAYILGTARHETGYFRTMEEDADGSQYEGRDDIGNVQPGDGVRFKGRGYVQVTGRKNAQRYTDLLKIDFINNPEKLEAPNVARYTLVHGMMTGIFTGEKLPSYVSGARQDFINARTVVNGYDQANLIAGYAQDYLGKVDGLIAKAGGAQPQTGGTPTTPKTSDKPDAPTASTPAIVQEAPPTETGEKGQEITITFGFDQNSAVEFTFIHTGTRHQMHLNATEFEGTCVRWALTRRIKNATYSNTTLKTLAEQVGRSYGLKVECPENGPTFTHLDQTGITDYALLRRECARIGWRLLDRDGSLIIEPRKVGEEAFLLEYGMNIASFSCEDRAQTDAANGRASATNTGETKAIVDSATGEIKQLRPENKGAGGTTGGTIGTVSALAGAVAESAVAGVTNTAVVTDTGAVRVDSSTVKPSAPESTTGSATAPVQGTIADDSEVTQEDAAAGSDNAKRVKGFPAKVTAYTSAEMLQVTPDTPVRTEGFLADFLNRVWVVDTIEHSWKGTLKSAIALYTPMKPKYNIAASGAGAGAAATTSTIATPAGKLQSPIVNGLRGDPFDLAGTIRGRPHRGIDMIPADGVTDTLVACWSGIVVEALAICQVGDEGCGGGFGNRIYIDLDGEWTGWTARYAHLASVTVQKGQKVTKGQSIGLEGNTGASGGVHLHFELLKGGEHQDPDKYLARGTGQVTGTYPGSGGRIFPLN